MATALESVDHQVLYGRRGTGKTHAFRYLAAIRGEAGDIGVYIDLRTIGSAEGIFDSEQLTPLERTARLLIDLLTEIHDAIMYAALDDNSLIDDKSFVSALDDLLASLRNIRFEGQTEATTETETEASSSAKASAKAKISAASLGASAQAGAELSESQTQPTIF
ncbi:hypothetical protein [Mycobacterium sp.]|uniref:hypothetical protein n=1 Tax=Mycobacterium sp. TaxID=1785 RepID=UPI0025DBEA47|nr:hypothetical protein [Mycobacterium sp.]